MRKGIQLSRKLLRAAIATTLGINFAPAFAQDQAAATPESETTDEVVVTGTRVATRTRLDSLAPVDVLPSAALESQGTTELAEALSTLAPSLDFPRPSITDGTDHIRPATLRGLAPDQTLVLVNSKRRHQSALVNVNGSVGRGSAAVDLNAIPMAAVESVEVLRDGASAQYGSDAIGGVINLRLRDAREGGDASLTFGQYDTNVQTERGERHASDGHSGASRTTTIARSTWPFASTRRTYRPGSSGARRRMVPGRAIPERPPSVQRSVRACESARIAKRAPGVVTTRSRPSARKRIATVRDPERGPRFPATSRATRRSV